MAIETVAAALLECATNALDPTPGRIIVSPGLDVAHDNCCEGQGQVWVRLISMTPSGRPFPQVDSAQQCGVTLWAATYGIGVVRCAHVLQEDGTAPTASDVTADAAQMMKDAEALDLALRCCYPAAFVNETTTTFGDWAPLKIVRWDPLGPLGGCVGGEWQVVVGLPVCGCP